MITRRPPSHFRSNAYSRRDIMKALISGGMLTSFPLLASCTGSPPSTLLETFSIDEEEFTFDEGGSQKIMPDKNGVMPAAELIKTGPLEDRALGQKSAPITMIEYASLGCVFCHHFHKNTFPQLKKNYIDTGKIYYILREFPIGDKALEGANVVRCAREKDFFPLFAKFLGRRDLWGRSLTSKDKLYDIAKTVGMSRTSFDSCLANQTIIAGIKWQKERGRALGVKGTPTFFINGQKQRGALTLKQIETIIKPYIT